MTREQADRKGFTAAKVGDPTHQKAVGEQRLREFLDDMNRAAESACSARLPTRRLFTRKYPSTAKSS
jgi:hypothetical protein